LPFNDFSLATYLNAGDGTFIMVGKLVLPFEPGRASFDDYDGDGDPDAAIEDQDESDGGMWELMELYSNISTRRYCEDNYSI